MIFSDKIDNGLAMAILKISLACSEIGETNAEKKTNGN